MYALRLIHGYEQHFQLGNKYVMAIEYNNAKIVTDGIVLALDAANPKSYPGTGTTWYDLSGNSIDASLINTVTYETNYQGEMSFDGTDDYAVATYNSTNFANTDYTWFCYARGEQISTSSHNMPDIGYGSGWWPRMGFKELQGNGWEWRSYSSGGATSVHNMTIVPSPTPSDWVCLAFTADYNNTETKGYYNGNLANTNNSFPDIGGNNSNFGIGRSGSTAGVWNEAFIGSFSIVLIYNRVLTAQEIQQNFNATRGRYGI